MTASAPWVPEIAGRRLREGLGGALNVKYKFVEGILDKGVLMLHRVNILIFDHFTYISRKRFLELLMGNTKEKQLSCMSAHRGYTHA